MKFQASTVPEIWRGEKFSNVGHETFSRFYLIKMCIVWIVSSVLKCDGNIFMVTDIWLFYYIADFAAKNLFPPILGSFLGFGPLNVVGYCRDPPKGTLLAGNPRFGE